MFRPGKANPMSENQTSTASETSQRRIVGIRASEVKTRALPALKPWNGFDLNQSNSCADACRCIAKILCDDKWHAWQEVVDRVAARERLQRHTIEDLIYKLIAHGDVRRHGTSRRIRLTTRWQQEDRHAENACPANGQQ
jgi:hypothetical protein